LDVLPAGGSRTKSMDRDSAAKAIDAFLRALDRDPENDPDLMGTADRVARAFIEELMSGYAMDVDGLLSHAVISGQSDVVTVRDVPVATTCPHHLMPSVGHAVVAFAPRDRLIGFGAVSRVVDAYSKRLALQEQIGRDVVTALHRHLAPRWVACRIVLAHSCMRTSNGGHHEGPVETLAIIGPDEDRSAAYVAVGLGH
jgi:GTP cyclohydrolase I